MPTRTRETIEAEIAALQAELASTQPKDFDVKVTHNGDFVRFSAYGSTSADPFFQIAVHRQGRRTFLGGSRDFGALRDWLNYHFPAGS